MLLVTGALFGFIVVTQARYFTTYVESSSRDSGENIFQKIQILKSTNEELAVEIKRLESQIEDLSTQSEALQSIEKELYNDQMIAGQIDVAGPGITLEIDQPLTEIWFTDIMNEMLVAGAEAISVNDIRITNTSIGFDTLPNGQIMLNSVILNQPYRFKAIGDRQTLKSTLETPRGILDRLKSDYSELNYILEQKDRIEMKKVL